MKKLVLALLLSVLVRTASAQTMFTNTDSGPCSVQYSNITTNGTYYCTAAQVFVNSTFDGYIGFWFVLKSDSTFTSGHVYRNDAHGNTVFTADDFAGTFTGVVGISHLLNGTIHGTFNGNTGVADEKFEIQKGHCYKGTCRDVNYITSGSGSY